MMENGTSLADLAAVSNMNNGEGWGNGSWLWFIIVIFCVFGGFGNGFGGNQYATSTQVQSGFDTQNIMQRFDTLSENQSRNAMDNMSLIDRNALDNANLINQNRYDNAQLINSANVTNMQNAYAIQDTLHQGFDGVNAAINQSTWTTNQTLNNGFNGINQGLCNLSHQISDGVCAIKTQMLQDKYDALLNDYNLSTMANSNSVQTQNILSAIGSWYAKPPYAPPVYAYGTTTT